MRFFKCIGFHDKIEKRIIFSDGRRGGRGEEEVQIKVMRTRVYLKASAEDKIFAYRH